MTFACDFIGQFIIVFKLWPLATVSSGPFLLWETLISVSVRLLFHIDAFTTALGLSYQALPQRRGWREGVSSPGQRFKVPYDAGNATEISVVRQQKHTDPSIKPLSREKFFEPYQRTRLGNLHRVLWTV